MAFVDVIVPYLQKHNVLETTHSRTINKIQCLLVLLKVRVILTINSNNNILPIRY